MIDAIILGIFALVIAIWFKLRAEQGPGQSALGVVLQLALVLIYMPALWASPMQATAGQRICALRVINAIDGDRVSFMRGLLRVFGMMLSGLILGIGFLMVAFTERKQGLHDMIASTYVVKDSLIGR